MKRILTTCAMAVALVPSSAIAQSGKPNILVIWGDDIGYWNLSVYSHGAMGYRMEACES